VLKKAATPAASAKKRKAESTPPAAAQPAAKKAAPAKAATPGGSGPEDAWAGSIAAYIKDNGKSPLSKLGNQCKRPAGLATKLKAFIASKPNLFSIDKDEVNLV
jgi:hypothetical protein